MNRTVAIASLACALAFAGAQPAAADSGVAGPAGPVSAARVTLAVAEVPHIVARDAGFDARVEVGRGFDLIRKGRQAQAIAQFDRVIAWSRSGAHDARPMLCRGGEGSHGAAVGTGTTVDPAVCDAHFGKGYALIDMGRGDLAEAELRTASEMAPGDAHYANEYAELFKARRDWPQSYAIFARAWAVVDKDPKGPDASLAARALRGMAFNKAEMGDFDAAESLLRQSLAFEPGSKAAQQELGHIARRKAIGS